MENYESKQYGHRELATRERTGFQGTPDNLGSLIMSPSTGLSLSRSSAVITPKYGDRKNYYIASLGEGVPPNGGTDPLSNRRVDLCVNERRREILRRFFIVQLCDIELVFVGGFREELLSRD